MTWKVEYAESVQKSIRKQSRQTQQWLRDYLEVRLARMRNPRQLGRAMRGTRYRKLWRYRVGDYRIIAEINDERIRILVVRIAHRRGAYRSQIH
ncbi:MAG: type II toxin-antitoxin system RelE/ParE family toxin [Acidobacteriota bacterium]|nr:type II toxin-antitoxin system RelE/ParE family toxin [Acidobacteriota bacterium]